MKRSKRGEKTVYLDDVSICWNEAKGRIRIYVKGEAGFASTVSADPCNVRGNPNLFYKLAKCLKAAGAPHPPIRRADSPT